MVDRRQWRFGERLYGWSLSNYRRYPWRDESSDPFHVLVAEVLLQRTPADRVEGVYGRVVEEYPTPESLAGADVESLAALLEPLGLHNRRAAALVEIASEVVERGGVPRDPDELVEWPQVGPYVANATACFAFDAAVPIVDANVERIYGRVFCVEDCLWGFAAETVPANWPRRYNLALLDFGALVCTARSPHCESCPMRGFCDYYQSTARDTR